MNTIKFLECYPFCIDIFKYTNYEKCRHNNKKSNTYRFMYIINGNCQIELQNQSYLCEQGDVFFLCPGQVYNTEFISGHLELINLYFSFQTEHYSDVYTHNSMNLGKKRHQGLPECSVQFQFLDIPHFNKVFLLKDVPFLESKLIDIFREYNEQKIYYQQHLNSMLTSLLIEVIRYLELKKGQHNSMLLNRVLDFIAQNCQGQITCQAVAKQFSYHPNYINKLVRDATGLSLHKYITSIKIKNATQVLVSTDMPITEIAQLFGFNDVSHFSTVYKAHIGFTPSNYRKR